MIFAFARLAILPAHVALILTLQGWRPSCVSLFCYCPPDPEVAIERLDSNRYRGHHFRVHIPGIHECL